MQAADHDVDDLALALKVSRGAEQACVACGGAIAVVDIGADDEIDDAAFVFESLKDDTGSGSRTLTDQDHSGDIDPLAVGQMVNFSGREDLQFA